MLSLVDETTEIISSCVERRVEEPRERDHPGEFRVKFDLNEVRVVT